VHEQNDLGKKEKLDEHLASCFSRKATRLSLLCILR
jgi:hypothetical protein